jgi:hypothetical protein
MAARYCTLAYYTACTSPLACGVAVLNVAKLVFPFRCTRQLLLKCTANRLAFHVCLLAGAAEVSDATFLCSVECPVVRCCLGTQGSCVASWLCLFGVVLHCQKAAIVVKRGCNVVARACV